jgi:hypothetical protein
MSQKCQFETLLLENGVCVTTNLNFKTQLRKVQFQNSLVSSWQTIHVTTQIAFAVLALLVLLQTGDYGPFRKCCFENGHLENTKLKLNLNKIT